MVTVQAPPPNRLGQRVAVKPPSLIPQMGGATVLQLNPEKEKAKAVQPPLLPSSQLPGQGEPKSRTTATFVIVTYPLWVAKSAVTVYAVTAHAIIALTAMTVQDIATIARDAAQISGMNRPLYVIFHHTMRIRKFHML
jgi:hypothetical protein